MSSFNAAYVHSTMLQQAVSTNACSLLLNLPASTYPYLVGTPSARRTAAEKQVVSVP